MGDRPARSDLILVSGILPELDEDLHVLSHRTQGPMLFKEEINDGRNSRDHQQRIREYRKKKGIKENVELRCRQQQQTKLNDWKEFQVY